MDADFIQKNSEILSTIYAKQEGERGQSKAVLLIKIVTTETDEKPEFSKPIYTGQYKEESVNKFVVELTDVVKVSTKKDSDKIEVNLVQTG